MIKEIKKNRIIYKWFKRYVPYYDSSHEIITYYHHATYIIQINNTDKQVYFNLNKIEILLSEDNISEQEIVQTFKSILNIQHYKTIISEI